MSEKEKMHEENQPDTENIRKDEEKTTSNLKSDQHIESTTPSEENKEPTDRVTTTENNTLKEETPQQVPEKEDETKLDNAAAKEGETTTPSEAENDAAGDAITDKEDAPTKDASQKQASQTKEHASSDAQQEMDDAGTKESETTTQPENENEPTQAVITDKKDAAPAEEASQKQAPQTKETASNDAQQEMDDAVAKESEDESTYERHGIEKKVYHSMSKQELTDELDKLLKKEKVQNIKEHVDELRNEFNAKFDEELEQKKEEFIAAGGNIIDFYYSTPLKKRFNSLYFDYKERRNRYFEQLRQDLNKNLQRRLEIIEELKGLIDVEENINTTYNNFKQLQDRWRNAGPIPRDKYNTIWNTYHHHVENFYDFLHLNREFRDLDFKHNLEQKLKVINRAEELIQEPDVNRAFRELQMLHKMWKEDLGPVEKVYRETIWDKFGEATRKIHDLRQAHFEEIEKEFEKNLVEKREIIGKLDEIAASQFTVHGDWQQKIKEVEALREAFFKAGKVPRNVNEQTWRKFKGAVRTFNRNKNAYYKGQKKEQSDNLEKKKDLLRIAEENKDSDDFQVTTDLMKRIQNEWKNVGHVSKKDSDKLWKRFKAACNHYFSRLHASRSEENKEEMLIFDQKKELLDSFRSMEFSGDRETDLPKIKEYIEQWKKTGQVSQRRRYIEGKFNKILDQAFGKLNIDKKEAEMLKYENKIQQLDQSDDVSRLNKEHFFLTKRIEEAKIEIRQLENNLQFFSNADQNNPLVQKVLKDIENHKKQLAVWQEKLRKVNSLYEES